MSVMEDVDVLLGLELSMDEVKACENDFHALGDSYHEGDAQWYIRLESSCNCVSNIEAVCDKYRETLRRVTDSMGVAMCSGCKTMAMMRLVVDERI